MHQSGEFLDKHIKSGFQHLKNWQGIVSFFADKEKLYYDKACQMTVNFSHSLIHYVLRASTNSSSKSLHVPSTDWENNIGTKWAGQCRGQKAVCCTAIFAIGFACRCCE